MSNLDTSQILEESMPTPCNLKLVIYFLISCLLFSVGFKITFFSPIEDEDINPTRYYWLIGPIILFLGTILAGLIYRSVKSKNLVELMERDVDLFTEISEPVQISPTANNSSYQNLPPSYTYATASSNRLDASYMAADFLSSSTFIEANVSNSANFSSSNCSPNVRSSLNNANMNAQSIAERSHRLIINNPIRSDLITKDLPPPAYSEIMK